MIYRVQLFSVDLCAHLFLAHGYLSTSQCIIFVCQHMIEGLMIELQNKMSKQMGQQKILCRKKRDLTTSYTVLLSIKCPPFQQISKSINNQFSDNISPDYRVVFVVELPSYTEIAHPPFLQSDPSLSTATASRQSQTSNIATALQSFQTKLTPNNSHRLVI